MVYILSIIPALIEKGTDSELPTVSVVLNVHNSMDVITLYYDNINAQTIQQLYEQVLAKNLNTETIYIISDNARY